MYKLLRFFFLSFTLIACSVSAQTVRFVINNLPVKHPPASDIYLSGSFNNWNPGEEKYKFIITPEGKYYKEINLPEGSYQFKLTRGSWEKVECGKGATTINNRNLVVEGNMTIELAIEEWNDNIPAKPKINTASKNVIIADTSFLIPGLNRKRTVRIYLPPGYSNSMLRYPVIYMHDGQNLFDDATSFSGEWGIDEYFDTTRLSKCIVVGIDNGGEKRMNEYNPWNNERFGKGEGSYYAGFIVKTLKPYIDKNFRTVKSKTATYIAGSSMGGLISLYAVLQYPKIFGGAGIFSPSVWINKNDLLKLINSAGKKNKSKLYFYCGMQESNTMASDMLKAFEALMKVSKTKMTSVIRNQGRHHESTWRNEFPLFYEWISK